MSSRICVTTLAILIGSLGLPTEAQAGCSGFPADLHVQPGEELWFTPRADGLWADFHITDWQAWGDVSFDYVSFGPHDFSGPSADLYFSFGVSDRARPGTTSTLLLQVIDVRGEVVCDNYVEITVAPPANACSGGAYWMDHGASEWADHHQFPVYHDRGSCFVRFVPAGEGSAFVWGNAYFVRKRGGDCDVGWDNGADCLLGWAPAGTQAFVWRNEFRYFE